MSNLFYNFLLEVTSGGTGDASGGDSAAGSSFLNSPWISIILIVGMLVLLYFTMIRPNKKRQKEEEAMKDALQVGDEVTTIGGIIGKVVSIKGDTFVLETTKDKTKIRFLKAAIRSVDVKVADLAAQVMEAKEAEATEAPAAEPEATEAKEEIKD